MKHKRPLLMRTAGVLVGVTAMASALAIPAATAHAYTLTDLQWCNSLSANVGIDAWSGSTWYGEADDNQCHTDFIPASGNLHVDFFLNNQATAINIGNVTAAPGELVEVKFTGTLFNINEQVTHG